MQLLVILGGREAERIEIGVQMSAHAIGADHHQRAHAVAGRAHQVVIGDGDAGGLTLGLQLVADGLLDLAPVAVEGGDEIVARRGRPVGLFPRRAARVALDRRRIVLEGGEEVTPFGVDARGILLEPIVEILDIARVRSIEERRLQQRLIEFLA